MSAPTTDASTNAEPAAGNGAAALSGPGARLLQRKQALEQLLAKLERMDNPVEGHADALDAGEYGDMAKAAQGIDLQERSATLRRIIGEELGKLHLALRQMERGEYGRCRECGQPIPEERLEVLPHATLCVPCQSRLERTRGRGRRW